MHEATYTTDEMRTPFTDTHTIHGCYGIVCMLCAQSNRQIIQSTICTYIYTLATYAHHFFSSPFIFLSLVLSAHFYIYEYVHVWICVCVCASFVDIQYANNDRYHLVSDTAGANRNKPLNEPINSTIFINILSWQCIGCQRDTRVRNYVYTTTAHSLTHLFALFL